VARPGAPGLDATWPPALDPLDIRAALMYAADTLAHEKVYAVTVTHEFEECENDGLCWQSSLA